MKLKYFTGQTLPKQMGGGGRKSDVATLNLSRFGIISFNLKSAELMALKVGDKLSLAQDEEDPQCLYFFKDPTHGFPLGTSSKGKALRFAHKGFVTLIAEAMELPGDKNIKGLIAGQPTVMKGDKAGTQYWGILIRPSV